MCGCPTRNSGAGRKQHGRILTYGMLQNELAQCALTADIAAILRHIMRDEVAIGEAQCGVG